MRAEFERGPIVSADVCFEYLDLAEKHANVVVEVDEVGLGEEANVAGFIDELGDSLPKL